MVGCLQDQNSSLQRAVDASARASRLSVLSVLSDQHLERGPGGLLTAGQGAGLVQGKWNEKVGASSAGASSEVAAASSTGMWTASAGGETFNAAYFSDRRAEARASFRLADRASGYNLLADNNDAAGAAGAAEATSGAAGAAALMTSERLSSARGSASSYALASAQASALYRSR